MLKSAPSLINKNKKLPVLKGGITLSKDLTEAQEKKMKRDQVRWRAADQDDDDMLTKEEFKAFVGPEGYDHTKVLYVRENLDTMDQDNDGYVSLEEFLGKFNQIWFAKDPKSHFQFMC